MEPFKGRNKHGPEFVIQREFIRYLRDRQWHVERMIGNMLQKGIPDIYLGHKDYGTRWVDLKNPVSYEFTKDQKLKWPKWADNGIGIWIITAATDEEYAKLFKPPNWREYWKDKYDEEPTIDELLEELNESY
jgi:hypothetical protein